MRMISNLQLNLGMVAVLTLVLLVPSTARANDVLVITPNDSSELSDSVQALQGTGLLGTVDGYDASVTTPSLTDLQAYPAVAIWSNFPFPNPAGMGNVLADYVDDGGAVVIMNAAGMHDNSNQNWGVSGNFVSGGYLPVIQNAGLLFEDNLALGTVHNASHPVMQNVNSVGVESILWNGTVQSYGTVIADWNTGYPLVVENDNHAVVYVNVFFYSATSSIWGYDPNSDVARLAANALNHAVSVAASLAQVEVSPTSMTFNATEGGANPSGQSASLTVTNGPHNWSASASQPWVSVSPSSGNTSQSLTVDVNVSGLSEGNHQATVTISAPGATGSPQTIDVTLQLEEAGSGGNGGNGGNGGGGTIGTGRSGCGTASSNTNATALLWLFALLAGVAMLRRVGRA